MGRMAEFWTDAEKWQDCGCGCGCEGAPCGHECAVRVCVLYMWTCVYVCGLCSVYPHVSFKCMCMCVHVPACMYTAVYVCGLLCGYRVCACECGS